MKAYVDGLRTAVVEIGEVDFVTVPPESVVPIMPSGPKGEQGAAGPGNSDTRQAFQNLLAGQAIQATIAGTYDLASALSINTSSALGLVTTPAASGFAATLNTGYVTLPSWIGATGTASLTPKAVYYLSASTPGGLTTVPPSTPGQCVVRIGVAISPQTMFVEIDKPYLLN